MNVIVDKFLPPANEVWCKVIFLVACVKNSVHGRGIIPGQVPPPPGRYPLPPRAGTSPPGRYPPGQVHPPGSSACWEIRATSGRYAPYWNAFLSELYLIEITLRHAFSDDFLFQGE